MSAFQMPVSGAGLLKLWRNLESKPLGKALFSKLLGIAIPYTGSVRPQVKHLEPGHAQIELHDKRAVRNHLASVHAIALANVGEFSTGLALMTRLPEGMRAILSEIRIEYLKKARGTLRAEARCEVIAETAKDSRVVTADIFDDAGNCVTRVHATWVVGTNKKGNAS